MIDPELESARPMEGAGFGDAVTFAFGDPATQTFGSVRFGIAAGDPAVTSVTLLFHEGDVVAVDSAQGRAQGVHDWARVDAGDASATIGEPLRRWEVGYDGDDAGFELTFEALGPPAEIGDDALARSAAAIRGYEQLCRVRGTARVGERSWPIDCLGQRGHQWGAPDWTQLDLTRTLSVWLDDDHGVTLTAVRPRGADGHEEELVSAFLLQDEPVAIDDPRLSTAHGADGRHERAGLELWISDSDDEDDQRAPLRAAGEAVCGTTFELGELRLDCAFFTWRMEGRRGVGRYDLLRRA
ncbi:MAG TPA: hypothetical protein VGM91_16735 [Conexibacter sp.]|jgi:hypothetical protein